MKIPSVTEVLNLWAKPGLPWAAANETAQFAIRHQDVWVEMTLDDAYQRLRRHHRGVWDHRAAVGSTVHSVNEAWSRGEEADLSALVEEHRGRLPGDEILDEVEVMVDALERAWNELQPETISSEDVIRRPKPERQSYIGQHDWRARINGHSWEVDLKTTGEVNPDKALYWPEWRLQLAAYRGCTEIVDFDLPGHRPYRRGAKEVGTRKLEPVECAAILQIRKDGTWQFHPVQAAGEELNRFLMLRELWAWKDSAERSGTNEDIDTATEHEQHTTTRKAAL